MTAIQVCLCGMDCRHQVLWLPLGPAQDALPRGRQPPPAAQLLLPGGGLPHRTCVIRRNLDLVHMPKPCLSIELELSIQEHVLNPVTMDMALQALQRTACKLRVHRHERRCAMLRLMA